MLSFVIIASDIILIVIGIIHITVIAIAITVIVTVIGTMITNCIFTLLVALLSYSLAKSADTIVVIMVGVANISRIRVRHTLLIKVVLVSVSNVVMFALCCHYCCLSLFV